MFQTSKLLRVVLIIGSIIAVSLAFVAWSWYFTTSRLKASAQSFGIFPSPTEAMMTEIRDGWVGIQEAWIRGAEPETALGGGPHVWFVTACVWAESRADGSPVGSATHDFDFPGGYYVETKDGWVPMSEESALFVGFWMKVFGLAGDGGGEVVHGTPSKPVCVPKSTETLQRLGDDNPAIRAGAAVNLVRLYEYKRLFGLGSSPYQEQIVFILQNSLKKRNEEEFVRQAIVQALGQINPDMLQGAWLKGADFSNLNIRNVSFDGAYLAYANLSKAASAEYKPGDVPVSFEEANLFNADITGAEFWGANFGRVSFEHANLSSSFFIRETDLRNAFFWRADLTDTIFYDQEGPANLEGAIFDATVLNNTNFSHALLSGAIFRNIEEWNDGTNFQGANCQGTQFDVTSDFYKWGQSKYPDCFK